MPKKQLLKEDLIFDFIEAVFRAILKWRTKSIMKLAEKDPEFRKTVVNLIQSRKELQDWAERRAQESPEFAKAMQDWEEELRRHGLL
jgi:hypothetical protein